VLFKSFTAENIDIKIGVFFQKTCKDFLILRSKILVWALHLDLLVGSSQWMAMVAMEMDREQISIIHIFVEFIFCCRL